MQPLVQPSRTRRAGEQPSRAERRRQRRRNRTQHVLRLGAATVVLALSAVTAVCVMTMHLGVRAVLTGSMRPDYGPGAVLLTQQVPTASVRPGMIVLFVPPGEHVEYAHRITTVTGPEDAPVITTKGDANKVGRPVARQARRPDGRPRHRLRSRRSAASSSSSGAPDRSSSP